MLLSLPNELLAKIFNCLIRDPEEPVTGLNLALACKHFYYVLNNYQSVVYKFTLNKIQLRFPAPNLLSDDEPYGRMIIRNQRFVYNSVTSLEWKLEWLLNLLTGLNVRLTTGNKDIQER